MTQELFLPTLAHWTYGNNWNGSAGKVRFFVTTSAETMLAEVWDEDVCRELAQIKESAEFPVTEEGIEEMRRWIVEQIMALGGTIS